MVSLMQEYVYRSRPVVAVSAAGAGALAIYDRVAGAVFIYTPVTMNKPIQAAHGEQFLPYTD